MKARQALERWDLKQAQALLKKKVHTKFGPQRTVLKARVAWQQSDYARVISLLRPLLTSHPRFYEARALIGRALYATGQNDRAFKILDVMAEDYNNDHLTKAPDLMWMGVGLQLTDYAKNASEAFGMALKADPKLHQARLLWAGLFIEKYNFRDSDELYKEVLKAIPHHPGALLGRARIDLESDRNYRQARKRALLILKKHPGHVPAHNLVARLDLDQERPLDAVNRLLKHSLRIAPAHPEALTLLAASYLVMDKDAAFKKVEVKALKGNPKFARFYSAISGHAARVHRYKKAIELNEKALKLDPEHWAAHANLGMGYSRIGLDAKAKKSLEVAHEGDGFNVRTYNLLEFFYDKVIKEFHWIDVAPMRLRVHRSQKSVLERYVPPLLKEAYAFLKKKYVFTPEQPLHVEIFHDKQLFSIRSTGLPRLGAHGICFGHVITARSPAEGNFNWAEVLWHELSHVFHIQLSKSRVPRWFTEGLAVYESTEARPEWRREMDETLLAYFDQGRLRGVADFNLSFTQAKSFRDILVAYYHAYLVTAFIVEAFGFPKMRALLVGWGARKTTEKNFSDVLKVSFTEFDTRFKAWLEKRIAYLRKNLTLDFSSVAKAPKKAVVAAQQSPKDAAVQFKAALAAYMMRNPKMAAGFVNAALALKPDHSSALLLRAKIWLVGAKLKEAKADLEAILKQGKDGAEIRTILATIARKEGKTDAASKHLERAIQLNPQDAKAYYTLVKILVGAGKNKAAFDWRKRLLKVDERNVKLVDALLVDAKKMGASPKEVLYWVQMGNHIAPFSLKHHLVSARVLHRYGLKKKAVFEAQSALLIDPANAEAKRILGLK